MKSTSGSVLTASMNGVVDESLYDIEVIPVSKSVRYSSLSPFFLGPVETSGYVFENMENAWQYSKVYKQLGHLNSKGRLTQAFWDWMELGSNRTKADRYPAGKGAVPEFSIYNREIRLSYVSARALMYIPCYASLVEDEDDFQELVELYESGKRILIRDYDCYRCDCVGDWFDAVRKNPHKKMGHGFVLAESIIRNRDRRWYSRLII